MSCSRMQPIMAPSAIDSNRPIVQSMARVPGTRPALAMVIALVAAVGCNGPETTPGQQANNPRIDGSDVLLVVGDWGAGTPGQEAVATAMETHTVGRDVGAIVTTGDNFYSDDADALMEPFSWATDAGIPFIITWGNHDLDGGDRIEAVNQVFDDPPRWTAHRWGDVEVVILDSTQPGSQEQVEFLTETLSRSERPTIIVVHHPRYTCGSHQDDEGVHEDLLAHLDDDVFLMLSGHEHNYQRFEDSSMTYVVTGGGGAALTEIGSCPPGHPTPVSAESAHHFLALEQGDGVTVSVIDVAGEPIDEFEVPLP